MSFTAVYVLVVGLSVLFFVGLYLRGRRKPSTAKPEPPRWHKWFDDPV
jgi:hypothetical protein